MKAIVFLADGFEECEGLLVVDILRRAGIETVMASVMGRTEVDSSRHIRVMADILAEDVDFSDSDIIILPGGRRGVENLWNSVTVKEQCRLFAENRHIAAICAAPSLLAALNLLEGKRATCHPDFEDRMSEALLTHESVATDGNIITGQGLGATFPFAFQIVRILIGEAGVQKIKRAICYREYA